MLAYKKVQNAVVVKTVLLEFFIDTAGYVSASSLLH